MSAPVNKWFEEVKKRCLSESVRSEIGILDKHHHAMFRDVGNTRLLFFQFFNDYREVGIMGVDCIRHAENKSRTIECISYIEGVLLQKPSENMSVVKGELKITQTSEAIYVNKVSNKQFVTKESLDSVKKFKKDYYLQVL